MEKNVMHAFPDSVNALFISLVSCGELTLIGASVAHHMLQGFSGGWWSLLLIVKACQ